MEGKDDKFLSDRNANILLISAAIYWNLGERQKALDKLEEAHRLRAFMIVFLKVSPQYDAMRGEPRFQAIFRQMN